MAVLPWMGLVGIFLTGMLCVVALVLSLVFGGFGLLMVGASNDSASSRMHCSTETVGVVVDGDGRVITPGVTTTECQNPDTTSIAEFLETLGWTAPPDD
ncbi:MAG: hypothetical protein P8J32_07790 [bacterium]|nr:hypothetical protein [bacterium]